MSKTAICIASGGRQSTASVALYAISALAQLENVTVFVHDGDNDPLWSDAACCAALNAIAHRSDLRYIRAVNSGIGRDRWHLLEKAMPEHERILLLDDDAIVPENFLSHSEVNIAAAPTNWGYIGHFGIDTLQFDTPGARRALGGAACGLETHYDWQATHQSSQDAKSQNAAPKNGLYPSYSICGFCAWYRSGALAIVADGMTEMVGRLRQGEDTGLSLMLASRFPCFVAEAPLVRHYRNVQKRTSKAELVEATQHAYYRELEKIGCVDEKRMGWFRSVINNFDDED